jgi:hypothetical protein
LVSRPPSTGSTTPWTQHLGGILTLDRAAQEQRRRAVAVLLGGTAAPAAS